MKRILGETQMNIKKLYLEKNKSILEISQILDLKYSTIACYISRNGWSKNQVKKQKSNIELKIKQCLKLHYMGISNKNIAKIFNLSYNSIISRYVNEENKNKYSEESLRDVDISNLNYQQFLTSRLDDSNNHEVTFGISEKPYIVLYDNIVVYKNKICEIIKGNELRNALRSSLMIKSKRV